MAVVLPQILRSPRNSDGPRGELSLLGAMSSHGDSEEEEEEELSFLAILLAVLRRYLARCMSLRETGVSPMEIGCPTDVRHVAHVTFDRFHGFLGLPVEFEPEVPRRAPSARFVSLDASIVLFKSPRSVYSEILRRGMESSTSSADLIG